MESLGFDKRGMQTARAGDISYKCDGGVCEAGILNRWVKTASNMKYSLRDAVTLDERSLTYG